MADLLKFPEGFWWGASSSSHQCEGGNTNDWSGWEQLNAERLATGAIDRYSKVSPVWRDIAKQATNPDNYRSGRAADHFNRYEEDFDLAKSLGMNMQRISLEWSRIEPEEGKFNQTAIEHYRKVIKAIRAHGMEPMVTIWHWTLPVWMFDKGSWRSPDATDYFLRYVTKVVEEFKFDCQYWITLNEPDVYTDFSYRLGQWPPGAHSYRTAYKVAKTLIDAHIESYRRIKLLQPHAQVGVAKNNIHFDLRRHWLVDYVIRNVGETVWNRYFLNKIAGHQDFIGLNHYFRYKHKHREVSLDRPHVYMSDMGWELHPESIYFVLKNLGHYKKPIIITENGVADMKDNFRGWYIENILRNVHRAMEDGVDVRGYLHWSLTDNFEWDSGFWPRFGLIEVDYATQKRTVRESAKEFAKIIRQNGVTPPTV